jgi:hypothetical protein
MKFQNDRNTALAVDLATLLEHQNKNTNLRAATRRGLGIRRHSITSSDTK